MAKIKMLQAMAAVNFSLVAGDELEVTDEVAKAWVEANIAELVEEAPKKKTTLKKGDQ